MASDKNTGTGNIRISKSDLDDPQLYRLNRKLDLMEESASSKVAGVKAAAVSAATAAVQAISGILPVPNAPVFDCDVSGLDAASAEIFGLAFPGGGNLASITGGSFTFYYSALADTQYTLAANVGTGDTSISVTVAPSTIAKGDYVEIGAELMQVNDAPSGTTIPVTRAQLGTTAATASSGDTVKRVTFKVVTVSFPPGFCTSADLDSWELVVSLPDTLLVAVVGSVSNSSGSGPAYTLCKTGTAAHGILLSAPAPGTVADTVYNIVNATCAPALSGAGTAVSPWLLVAGQQILNVVATSQDEYIVMPPTSGMQGKTVKVNLSSSSTDTIHLQPNTGDMIVGSGSDYVVSSAGSSITFEAIGTDWLIVAASGSISTPTAPDAPNVTGATVTVNYGLLGNDAAFGFSGSITLPTGDPNYSHLKKIHVVWYRGTTFVKVLPVPIYAPFGSSPIPWTTGNPSYLQDSADHTDSVKFLCENDSGVITANPYSTSVTIHKIGATSVSGTETSSANWTVDMFRVIYTSIDYVVVLANNQVPQNVTTWYSLDGGIKAQYCAWQLMSSVGQTLHVTFPKPAADTNVYLYCATGAIGGDGTTLADVSSLSVYGVVTSAAIIVAGLPTPGSAVVTNIAAGTLSTVIDQVTGLAEAQLDGMTWTDPTDKSVWLVKFYVRDTDGSGNPAPDSRGTWREWFESEVTGGNRSAIGLDILKIGYRPASDTHQYLQIQCVAVNRNSKDPTDWSGTDTSNSVAQGSPILLNIGATAPAATAISGADASTLLISDPNYHARFQDSATALRTVLNATISMNAYSQWATLWLDKQDGAGNQWQGWFLITGPAQVVQIGLPDDTQTAVYPPGGAADGSWIFRLASGRIAKEDGVPSTAISSAAFTVPTIPAPGATMATGAYIDQINYGNNGQVNTWGWNNLFTALPYDDPTFFFGRWTVQNGAGTGLSFVPGGQHDGDEVAFTDDDGGGSVTPVLRQPGTNTVAILNNLMWTLPAYKLDTGALNPNSTFRFRNYVATRRNTDGTGGTLQQQSDWSTGVGDATPGTAAYFDVVLDLTKAQVQGQQIADATVTGGKVASKTITATNIGDATITATQIANATITGAQIGSATIAGSNIVSATITATQIANATITGTQIASATITGGNIGSATISGSNIQAASITGTQIAASTVAGSNIAASTVAGSNIAASTVAGSNIAASTVAGSNIANGTVAGANIASLTIAAANIQDLTINGVKLTASAVSDSSKIATNAIVSSNIAPATIIGGNIAAATIVGSNIANSTITSTQIANATITGTDIANATITATNVANGTLTGTQVQNLSITATQIANLTITASQIANYSLDITKLAVGTLTVANISGWDGASISVTSGVSFTTGGYSTVINGNSITTAYVSSMTYWCGAYMSFAQPGLGQWTSPPLRLGPWYLWMDASSRLRVKASSLPTSDTDGTIIGPP